MKKLAEAKNMMLDEFVNFLFENAMKSDVESMHEPAKKKKVYITRTR